MNLYCELLIVFFFAAIYTEFFKAIIDYLKTQQYYNIYILLN